MAVVAKAEAAEAEAIEEEGEKEETGEKVRETREGNSSREAEARSMARLVERRVAATVKAAKSSKQSKEHKVRGLKQSALKAKDQEKPRSGTLLCCTATQCPSHVRRAASPHLARTGRC